MQLELKESSSPFWLHGLKNGKYLNNTKCNEPCYHVSEKKQYSFAKEIATFNLNVDEVYLVTGTDWDNMNNSWGAKEKGAYIRNKGVLLWSKNKITKYMKKYEIEENDDNMNLELKEDKYPKGVSRDPLPKKGAKLYTSPATALENQRGENKMKLELKDEGSTKLKLNKGDKFKNGETTWYVMDQNSEYTFINALKADGTPNTNRFAVVWGLQTDGTWNQGHYFNNIIDATKYFENETIVPVEEANNQNLDDETILNMLKAIAAGDLGKAREIGEKALENNKEIKTESKIVTPVGNPQVANSFVNIDVDLDHLEVSDFIVRLAQAIRSEQLAITEYVALRSANGITNEDRSIIDNIIEEEKNHMVAITTCLYKQILINHPENVDKANTEFVLPKVGMEIFDNSSEGKLQESLQITVNKLCKEAVNPTDEFYVGDDETGRVYYGIDSALDAVKFLLNNTSKPVVIYSNNNEEIENESTKLIEDTFNTIDELIKELSTDTNYDEIAYHIHEYSKTNKAKALELMNLLFELERDKSPKECRDEIIKSLEENKQYKTEDTKITQKDNLWNVEVDVEYDHNEETNVAANVSREVEIYKDKHKDEFKITDVQLTNGKFYFIIDKQINEKEVEDFCNEIFDKATNYEYDIRIK